MVIAFIPLRIGSKSIPKKNIKLFGGEPLFIWALRAACVAQKVDKVVIASDSEEIDALAQKENSPKVEIFSRSTESASDTASTEQVMLEYLEQVEFTDNSLFILIQATSPFLRSEDLDMAINQYENGDDDSLLSVVRIKRFIWSENGEPVNYDPWNRPRRQDFDGLLVENGAFYINKVASVIEQKNRLTGKVGCFEMSEQSFFEIDEEEDWVIAENLFNRQKKVANVPIKLVLSDVDGVLTDAGMYYSESGDELKKFNTRDGMGFQILREKGYKTGIITSESTEIVQRRAEKLKLDYLMQGKMHQGKLNAAQEIIRELGITLDEVAYIGDDINCRELLNRVGLAACPSDADIEIKSIPGIRTLEKRGGEGVFREFVGIILDYQDGF